MGMIPTGGDFLWKKVGSWPCPEAAPGPSTVCSAAGAGMVLLPMLSGYVGMEEDNLFPASVAMIFPICMTSL